MNDQFLKVAKQAAIEAGKVIMSFYGKDHNLTIKTDRSDFATQADLAAEKVIVGILSKNFPAHNIISEEKLSIDHKSEYSWVIDPVDGTVSFASNMPFFAVSIGLLEKNQPMVGVIYHVEHQDLYWAARGQGAFLNGQKISVSKVNKLENAVVAVGFGSLTRRKQKLHDYFFPLLNKVLHMYMLGCGAITMALVARGSLDAFPNNAWVWDLAAAGVIIPEAGGKVTDRFGNPVDWSAKRVEFICSNGLIHDELLEALK